MGSGAPLAQFSPTARRSPRLHDPGGRQGKLLWLALALGLVAILLVLRAVLAAELRDASPTWVNRGLERGAVLALAVHEGSVYAVTTEGAFRSGGGGWDTLFEPRAGNVVRSGAIRSGASLAIAVGDDDGVHLSDASGTNWSAALPPALRALVFGVGFGRAGEVFAGQEGAVLRSRDGGRTWERSTAGVPPEPFRAFSIDPAAPDHALAGGDAGLYISRDGGMTWQQVLGWPRSVQVRSIVRHPTTPSLVYAGGVGQAIGGLFASRDGGGTWERLGEGSLRTDHINTVLITSDGLYVGARGVADTDVIGGVWGSRDDGRTWEQVKTKLSNSDVGALALDPGPPRRLYAGTEGGVVFSYTLDAWWLRLLPLVPALALLEPLLVGVALVLLVLLFASLRRRPVSTQAR